MPRLSQTAMVLVVPARVMGQKVTLARLPCNAISRGSCPMETTGSSGSGLAGESPRVLSHARKDIPRCAALDKQRPALSVRQNTPGTPRMIEALRVAWRADITSCVPARTARCRPKRSNEGVAMTASVAATLKVVSSSSSDRPATRRRAHASLTMALVCGAGWRRVAECMRRSCVVLGARRNVQNACIQAISRRGAQPESVGYTRRVKPLSAPTTDRAQIIERLTARGVRPTAQRVKIAALLLSKPQHLSAEEIIATLRASGLKVSKATVYNTLNLFAAHGLIRPLTVDLERTVFDSHVEPHYHMHDLDTGGLTDLPPSAVQFSALPEAPPGMEIVGVDLTIRLRRRT
jgi:Fur family transcriptional regulator, iron response regulator